jgi:hypothetical protein
MNSQSHATNNSSLRPRNRRLISIEGDSQSSGPSISSAPLTGSNSSISGSRNASPLSSIFASQQSSSGNRPPPSRSQTTNKQSTKWGWQVPTPSTANFLFSPKYWEDSWSSIQGVATTLLGTDIQDAPRSATLPRSHKRNTTRYGGPAEDEWGPTINVENHLATGSKEDRLAQIQAKKREALLTANGYSRPDSLGRYKRKLSVDRAEATGVQTSGDALVYLHKVLPNDTSAGIAIKYNCPEPIFRKANRLWPNDSIQIRKIAYVPVESCGVRGQKISTPPTACPPQPTIHEDIVSSPVSSSDWSIPTTPKASQPTASTLATSPSLSATTTSHENNQPWIHESWVKIDNFPEPVEIARLPRQTLGFFPPARRKSIPYEDTTPVTSPLLSPALSPSRDRDRPFLPARAALTRNRTRSSSTTQTAFASALKGPGGVGTLGIEARAPGPAQDKLNQLFAHHLPNVAPRTSLDSIRSANSSTTGLENLGGKVEGWVRKLAARGIREVSGQHEGDLIELMDSWELGSSTGRNGDGGSETEMDQAVSKSNSRLGSRDRKGKARDVVPTVDGSIGSGNARSESEEALRERFPIRGRVFEEQTRRN